MTSGERKDEICSESDNVALPEIFVISLCKRRDGNCVSCKPFFKLLPQPSLVTFFPATCACDLRNVYIESTGKVKLVQSEDVHPEEPTGIIASYDPQVLLKQFSIRTDNLSTVIEAGQFIRIIAVRLYERQRSTLAQLSQSCWYSISSQARKESLFLMRAVFLARREKSLCSQYEHDHMTPISIFSNAT